MVVEDYPRVVAEFKAPSALNALPWRPFSGFWFSGFPLYL